MQVTRESIEEASGNEDFGDWFVKTFGEKAKVNSRTVIKKLREQKPKESCWIRWLLLEYKFSGVWELFYPTGALMARISYKNGKRNGLYEYFYCEGSCYERGTYKNDEIISRHNMKIKCGPKKGRK